MSEAFPTNHEQPAEKPETEPASHRPESRHHSEKHAEHVAERQNSIDEILKKIEKEAPTTETLLVEVVKEEKEAGEDELIPVNNSLKNHALHQSLRKVQSKLPAPERAFSKVIHQPIVEQISDVTSETIARPSGLLAGGLFSVMASVGVLIVCRYYGYEYNFLIGLMAFVGGFVCGISLEGAFRLAAKLKSR
jgi:hypothetical protein